MTDTKFGPDNGKTMRTASRAALFRTRAAELREIALTMRDKSAGMQLLHMALTYDTLALRLEGGASDDVSPDTPADQPRT